MTKDEILSLYKNYRYNLERHYNYEYEYCHMKFEKAPSTGSNATRCDRHPLGPRQGSHKVHSINQDKLWVE